MRTFIQLAIAFLLLFALSCGGLTAQEAGMISPLVGPTVDQVEYQRYGLEVVLEREAESIDSLRVIPRDATSFLLFFYLSDGSTAPQEVDRSFLRTVRTYIEDQNLPILRQWADLGETYDQGGNPRVFAQTFGGGIYRGQLMEITPYLLTLSQGQGEIVLRMEDLLELGLQDEVTVGAVGNQDDRQLGYMRYFFTQNAIPTRKGESLLGLTRLTYHRGLTNNLSVSINPSLLSLLYSVLLPEFFTFNAIGNVKYGRRVLPKLHLAANGTFAGGFLNLGNTVNVGYVGGLVTGLATFGDYDNNITIGGGLAGFQGFADIRSPLTVIPNPFITLGANIRLSDALSIVTENWTWGTSNTNMVGGLSNGLRIYGITAGGKMSVSIFYVIAGLGTIIVDERANGTRRFTSVFPVPLPFVGLYVSL